VVARETAAPFFLFAALSPRHSARVHKRSTGRCLSAAPMPTVLIKLRPTHEASLRPIFAPAVEHLQDGIAQSLSDVADQASMVRSSLEPFRKFRTDGIAEFQEPRARVSSPCAATWRTAAGVAFAEASPALFYAIACPISAVPAPGINTVSANCRQTHRQLCSLV
jgi:hypothetical protein